MIVSGHQDVQQEYLFFTEVDATNPISGKVGTILKWNKN